MPSDYICLDSPLIKFCGGCSTHKPLDAFYRDSHKKDGLQTRCRDCQKASAIKDRRLAAVNYPERLRQQKAAYRQRHLAKIAEKKHSDYLKNSDKIKDKVKKWARDNPSRLLERIEVWKVQNLDKIHAYKKKYRQNHLHKYAGYRQVSRALKKSVLVDRVDPLTVFERDQWICGICLQAVNQTDASIDHIIPLSKGGEHSYSNTQCAHLLCNSKKGNRVKEV